MGGRFKQRITAYMIASTKGLSFLFPSNKLGFNSLKYTLWAVAGLCWAKKRIG